jgi:hypothetical protein
MRWFRSLALLEQEAGTPLQMSMMTRFFIGLKSYTLLEILSFATNHYAIGIRLVVICNYLNHVCNYKFGIV